jgi:nucleotide-binding universal stress UspA family protein
VRGKAQVKKLLCPTDFSLRSELAVDRAAALARKFGAELVLLHAVDDDQPREMVDRRRDEARGALAARVAGIRQRGELEADIEVRVGTAFAAILEAARESNADLIVMGAHRRHLLRDFIAGTTIERVLRAGSHPVLMVNAAALVDYESVVVALDASAASARAVRVVKALGLLEDTRVSVVHAFEPIYKGTMSWAGVKQETVDHYSATWAKEAADELHRFLRSIDAADAIPDVVLEEGPPFPSIKRVVERTHPHLLVIGTRGLAGFKRLLLGSVAERVISEIECDILAVPPVIESDA